MSHHRLVIETIDWRTRLRGCEGVPRREIEEGIPPRPERRILNSVSIAFRARDTLN